MVAVVQVLRWLLVLHCCAVLCCVVFMGFRAGRAACEDHVLLFLCGYAQQPCVFWDVRLVPVLLLMLRHLNLNARAIWNTQHICVLYKVLHMGSVDMSPVVCGSSCHGR